MTLIDSTPICSVCTTDWNDRLGYCEQCAARQDDPSLQQKSYVSGAAGMLEDNFS